MPRKSYPPEFKQETASLVLDQGYSRKAAAEAMGVGYTALEPVYDPVKSTVCKRYSRHFEPAFCCIQHYALDCKQALRSLSQATAAGAPW